MSSKQEPYRLHIAIFNTLRAIEVAGGSTEIISHVKGGFSRNLWTRDNKIKSRFINNILTRFSEVVLVDWKAQGLKDATTIEGFLKEIEKDGIPDIFLSEITFEIPWVKYSEYTFKNEDIWVPWVFTPYNFKPGVWQALKAQIYPAEALYNKFRTMRTELRKDLDKTTKKRWRDTLLLNKAKPELENQEIRLFWQNKRFALILKEARGRFDLMDLGEWRF